MDPFKDIRPYSDSEVASVLQSLSSNPSVQLWFHSNEQALEQEPRG